MELTSTLSPMLQEWREVTVEDLKASTNNALATGPFGSSIGARFFEERGVPVIRGSNLSTDGSTQLIEDGFVFVSEAKAVEFRRSIVTKGDLVFTCWGTINQVGLIGERALYERYVISNKQMKFTPDKKKADSLFLYYLFSGPALQRRIIDQGIGSSVPGFNLGQLRAIRFSVPPLSEQRAIANALRDVDYLIQSLDKLITKKRDIKLATMQQLLTGKQRLPGFRGEWELKRFGELFQFLSTANNPRADLSAFGEVGYIHYGDIHTTSTASLNCAIVDLPLIDRVKVASIPLIEDGDLVMVDASEDYEGIGKCIEIRNVCGRKIVAGLHTYLLRGDKTLLANGFKSYLQFIPSVKAALIRFATGISVYGISKNNVRDIRILLPPIDEQNAIANTLSDMDTEIAMLEQRRDKTRSLKQGMMQELLTGKTKLIEAPEASLMRA